MSKTDLNKILHCDFFYGISDPEGKTKTDNRERINASPRSGCRIRNVGPEGSEDVGQQMVITDTNTLITKYKNKWLEEFLTFRRSENAWDFLFVTKKEGRFILP